MLHAAEIFFRWQVAQRVSKEQYTNTSAVCGARSSCTSNITDFLIYHGIGTLNFEGLNLKLYRTEYSTCGGMLWYAFSTTKRGMCQELGAILCPLIQTVVVQWSTVTIVPPPTMWDIPTVWRIHQVGEFAVIPSFSQKSRIWGLSGYVLVTI